MKRYEGKNLEEALESAASDLGVERFEIKYAVVSEKRGFLGGVKRVVIEAEPQPKGDPTPKTEAPVETAQAPRAEKQRSPRPEGKSARKPANRKSRDSRGDARRKAADDHDDDGWVTIGPADDNEEEPKPTEEKPERAAKKQQAKSEKKDQPREDGREKGRGRRRGGRRRRGGGGGGAKTEQPRQNVEIPEQGEQSDEARDVVEWCTKVFELSGLDLVARSTETDEEIEIELFGGDASRAQQNGGELLDSIQVLVNKSQVGRRIERRIELDVEGFKKARTEELTRKATEIAASVKEDGREKALSSMTPIERRIIHMTVREIEGVTTESRGRGFHKRVVILPEEEGQSDRVAAGE